MSGSGGGTWIDQPSDDCARLSQQTTLNSPNKSVVSQLKKGDLLEIQLSKQGKGVLVEAVYRGQLAGTITSSIIQRLAECIEGGYSYVAEVIDDVRGGACRVHVHLK